MASLYIQKDDVDYAANYLVQYLRDSGFTGDLTNGSAVYDLLIKPYALLYTLFKSDVERAKAYFSIPNAVALKDILGDEFDDVIDYILGNWFVTRKEGTSSNGYIRLYFSQKLDFLQVTTDNKITINTVDYHPMYDYVFTENDFNIYVTLEGVTYYCVDIAVVSSSYSDEIPAEGTEATIDISNLFLIKAEVVGIFTPGKLKESSEDFISRTRTVITTREAITNNAINTLIQDNFEDIRSIYVAGYGSYELLRDIKNFAGVDIHVGNMADIYVAFNLYFNHTNVLVPTNRKVTLSSIPVIDIFKAYNNTKNKEAIYKISDFNELTYLQSNSNMTLDFTVDSSVSPGDKITIYYYSSTVIPDIVNFFNEQRIVCYNPFIKSNFPITITADITIRCEDGYLFDDVALDLKKEFASYINSLPPADPLIVSKLIYYLVGAVRGLQEIVLPLTLNYSCRNLIDGTVYKDIITTQFEAPSVLSRQQTLNTRMFVSAPDIITVTQG